MVREAEEVESKANFIHKMAFALKEAHKIKYRILLLHQTEYTTRQSLSIFAKRLGRNPQITCQHY